MSVMFTGAATLATNAPSLAPTPVANAGAGNVLQSTYTLTAALTLNQVIQMAPIPAGARITRVQLSTDDLDSNVSPAVVLAVGDTGSATRFISGSTVGQAGGVTSLNQHGGHAYKYAAADTITVKVTTAPATGATSGTIVLTVGYQMDA